MIGTLFHTQGKKQENRIYLVGPVRTIYLCCQAERVCAGDGHRPIGEYFGVFKGDDDKVKVGRRSDKISPMFSIWG